MTTVAPCFVNLEEDIIFTSLLRRVPPCTLANSCFHIVMFRIVVSALLYMHACHKP